MLIHEMLNKDTDKVPQESPIIILDIRSAVCMDNNDKDANKTRHISIRVNFVRNGEKCNMHKIDLCEGGPQLADIVTKNVGENYLNPIITYIMVRLNN